MGDGKVKLGRGPYAISTAILSMYAGFQHPGTNYMLAPGHKKFTFFMWIFLWFCKIVNLNNLPQYLQGLKSWLNQVQNTW